MDLWDIVQQVQIQNLKGRVAAKGSALVNAAAQARTVETELTHRVDRLVLVTEAMWELLSERLGVTVADLAERVREIDLRDGTSDGKRGTAEGTPLLRCPSCQAAIPPGKTTCQFCGAVAPGAKTDPFQV